MASSASRHLPDMANVEIDVGFAHGDIGPGNMLDAGRGGVFMFDWENASDQSPVLTDPVGLWLACRQRAALKRPRRVYVALRSRFAGASETALLAALAFLCGHGNLAAMRMLEQWQ